MRHRDTVLLDLLFSICYKFSTLSYVKMEVPPKMGSVQINLYFMQLTFVNSSS